MGRSGSGWGDDWDRDGGRPPRGGRGDPRGLSSSQISSALREAQQLQQEGHLEEAIGLCEDLLDQGVDRSDARYFLGWLYQEAERWDDAAGQFQTLLADPDYVLSCFYALGQCSRATGNIQEAAQYFDEAVDRVNLDELSREESDQLLQLCQEAAEAHRELGDLEGAETVYSALLGFLRSRGWQEQAEEIERLMAENGAPAPQPGRRRRTGIPSQRANMPQRANVPSRNLPGRQGPPAAPGMPPSSSFSAAMPSVSQQVNAVGQMAPGAALPDPYSPVAPGGVPGMSTGDPLDDLIASFS
ncbi:MAG: tetratricopeptide repeat protein, partial [Ktedonobacterales bacterium]